ARAIVRSKGFQNFDEYHAWKERPLNIPSNPNKKYAESGWVGYGDWLGVHNKWTKTAILAFVSSLVPLLGRFQPSEIYSILRQNGCLTAVDSLAPSSPLRRLVETALHQDKEGLEHSLRELGLENLDDEEIQPSPETSEREIAETAIPSSDAG